MSLSHELESKLQHVLDQVHQVSSEPRKDRGMRGCPHGDRLRGAPCFPEGSQVMLPRWRLECGLLLVPLHGSMAPQTPQRDTPLWARSMRRHGMSGGCEASCAPARSMIPTTEEGTPR